VQAGTSHYVLLIDYVKNLLNICHYHHYY